MTDFAPAEPMLTTWDCLIDFGFSHKNGEESYTSTQKIGFDFGNLQLGATQCWNETLQDVVLVTGNFCDSRSMGILDFELPTLIESHEQCAAWVAWHIFKSGRFRVTLLRVPPWLQMGRESYTSLPWNRRLAEYEARPRCTVERDWMRQALKALRKQIESTPNSPIYLAFDGGVLTFRLEDHVIPPPAQGRPWPHSFEIPASRLTRLPSRLMHPMIDVSIWEMHLRLANYCYSGVAISHPAAAANSS